MRDTHEKFTCYLFGEGSEDIKFVFRLVNHRKFHFHTVKWIFSHDHSSGIAPKDIAFQCNRTSTNKAYDLILCFIDIDKLKHDYPTTWAQERLNLEQTYQNIKFIWQIENLEDELKKVYSGQRIGKYKLNKWARDNVDKFVNSSYWNNLKKIIKNKEKTLESKRTNSSNLD